MIRYIRRAPEVYIDADDLIHAVRKLSSAGAPARCWWVQMPSLFICAEEQVNTAAVSSDLDEVRKYVRLAEAQSVMRNLQHPGNAFFSCQPLPPPVRIELTIVRANNWLLEHVSSSNPKSENRSKALTYVSILCGKRWCPGTKWR